MPIAFRNLRGSGKSALVLSAFVHAGIGGQHWREPSALIVANMVFRDSLPSKFTGDRLDHIYYDNYLLIKQNLLPNTCGLFWMSGDLFASVSGPTLIYGAMPYPWLLPASCHVFPDRFPLSPVEFAFFLQ